MTESPFPFGAVEDSPYDDEPAKDRKRNLIALGALAVVALAGGAFLFLGGGDDLEQDVALTPPPAATAPAAEAPVQAVTLPVATTEQLVRNPFEVGYIQPPPPAAETPASGEGGSSTDSGGGSSSGAPISGRPVTSIPVGGGTSNPAPVGGGAPAPAPTSEQFELVLRSVVGDGEDRAAVFTVGGTEMTPKVGDTFGPTGEIKLLSLQEGPKENQWTAVLQVGDGSPFDVVTGDPVYVR